jgi:hypothetical protein
MAELESIRPIVADIMERRGDALFDRAETATDAMAHQCWRGAATLHWVEERESGPNRVLELEAELEGVRCELDEAMADAASVTELEREVAELKAKIKKLESPAVDG